jgi:hypothetical protein
MKRYILYLAAAIAIEILVMVVGTIAGFEGKTFLIAILIVPVSLFIAAIYLFIRSFRGTTGEGNGKSDDAGK